jgi:hypothetical protein
VTVLNGEGVWLGYFKEVVGTLPTHRQHTPEPDIQAQPNDNYSGQAKDEFQ